MPVANVVPLKAVCALEEVADSDKAWIQTRLKAGPGEGQIYKSLVVSKRNHRLIPSAAGAALQLNFTQYPTATPSLRISVAPIQLFCLWSYMMA